MDWKEYTIAMLLFSAVSMLVLYLIERVQGLKWMPWNPQHLPNVPRKLPSEDRERINNQKPHF